MLLVVPSMSVRIARMGMEVSLKKSGDERVPHRENRSRNAELRVRCIGARHHKAGAIAVSALSARPLVPREALRDIGAGEVPDPAVRLGEETDRDEARL